MPGNKRLGQAYKGLTESRLQVRKARERSKENTKENLKLRDQIQNKRKDQNEFKRIQKTGIRTILT